MTYDELLGDTAWVVNSEDTSDQVIVTSGDGSNDKSAIDLSGLSGFSGTYDVSGLSGVKTFTLGANKALLASTQVVGTEDNEVSLSGDEGSVVAVGSANAAVQFAYLNLEDFAGTLDLSDLGQSAKNVISGEGNVIGTTDKDYMMWGSSLIGGHGADCLWTGSVMVAGVDTYGDSGNRVESKEKSSFGDSDVALGMSLILGTEGAYIPATSEAGKALAKGNVLIASDQCDANGGSSFAKTDIWLSDQHDTILISNGTQGSDFSHVPAAEVNAHFFGAEDSVVLIEQSFDLTSGNKTPTVTIAKASDNVASTTISAAPVISGIAATEGMKLTITWADLGKVQNSGEEATSYWGESSSGYNGNVTTTTITFEDGDLKKGDVLSVTLFGIEDDGEAADYTGYVTLS